MDYTGIKPLIEKLEDMADEYERQAEHMEFNYKESDDWQTVTQAAKQLQWFVNSFPKLQIKINND